MCSENEKYPKHVEQPSCCVKKVKGPRCIYKIGDKI